MWRLCIGCQDRRIFDLRLGDQQAIEWIAMMVAKLFCACSIFLVYREKWYVVRPDCPDNVAIECEFAKIPLDRNLPDRNCAYDQPIAMLDDRTLLLRQAWVVADGPEQYMRVETDRGGLLGVVVPFRTKIVKVFRHMQTPLERADKAARLGICIGQW